MGDYEIKGQDFLAKADKKLKGMSFFGNKYEDAAELLEKASNNFKLAKNCTCGNRWMVLMATRDWFRTCGCSRLDIRERCG